MSNVLFNRRRARGVTLVEVLIVVAILSLITAAVAIFAIPQFIKAQREAALVDARQLVTSVDAYRATRPESLAECPTLAALKSAQILKPEQNVLDPWRHEYRIACEGLSVAVSSDGPDGVAGNEDDLRVGPPAKK